MKYLKIFEDFQEFTPMEIKETCEDILLEVKDLGFRAKVDVDGQWVRPLDIKREPKSWVHITISKTISVEDWLKLVQAAEGSTPGSGKTQTLGNTFKIEEIIDCIDRLDGYLLEFGFKKDEYDMPSNPSIKLGDRYIIRTDKHRNPNNFSLVGMRSYVDLWYVRYENKEVEEI